MGLTARQRRVLESMEERLRVREPRLVSMFSLFTRLSQNEAIPATEAVSSQRWRDLARLEVRKCSRSSAVRLIGLALAPFIVISLITAALAGLGAPRGPCSATPFHYSASKIELPQRACASRP